MTRDDVIRLAREADCLHVNLTGDKAAAVERLKRFAALVAAAEREECAKVCENEAKRALWNWENDISDNNPFWNGAEQLTSRCAAAIRARKP